MTAEIDRLRDLALLLGCKSAIERVASFFVDLIGDDAGASAEILLPVSRAEMAAYLGVTIETVSRNITLLETERPDRGGQPRGVHDRRSHGAEETRAGKDGA